MDLTDKAGRASTRCANSAPGYLPAAAIAGLAGTGANLVMVARHQATIESRASSRKAGNAVRVMQRGNTCTGTHAVISDLRRVASDGSRRIERE
jgi:hypothetical protein